MTTATFNQYRLTDAVERDLLRNAFDAQNALRPVAALKSVAKVVIKGVRGFVSFVADVSNEMEEARARSPRFSGAQW